MREKCRSISVLYGFVENHGCYERVSMWRFGNNNRLCINFITLIVAAVLTVMFAISSNAQDPIICGGYQAIRLSDDTKITATESTPVLGRKLYVVTIVFSKIQEEEIDSLFWNHGGKKTTVTVCVNGTNEVTIDWYLSMNASHNSISMVLDNGGRNNIMKVGSIIDVGSNGSTM